MREAGYPLALWHVPSQMNTAEAHLKSRADILPRERERGTSRVEKRLRESPSRESKRAVVEQTGYSGITSHLRSLRHLRLPALILDLSPHLTRTTHPRRSARPGQTANTMIKSSWFYVKFKYNEKGINDKSTKLQMFLAFQIVFSLQTSVKRLLGRISIKGQRHILCSSVKTGCVPSRRVDLRSDKEGFTRSVGGAEIAVGGALVSEFDVRMFSTCWWRTGQLPLRGLPQTLHLCGLSACFFIWLVATGGSALADYNSPASHFRFI
ncbi:hypothetical protein E1301_Tti000346 [Triplophysa tibetana]|uniref:Uncharacterized protein n=1 Tax=Triplophysa tibetana TaxID=1572043 RepID=A0A5A9N2W9_9TELE|nr:hypothetical protein E1301_Tti000346 [Triplophysa tibetana]